MSLPPSQTEIITKKKFWWSRSTPPENDDSQQATYVPIPPSFASFERIAELGQRYEDADNIRKHLLSEGLWMFIGISAITTLFVWGICSSGISSSEIFDLVILPIIVGFLLAFLNLKRCAYRSVSRWLSKQLDFERFFPLDETISNSAVTAKRQANVRKKSVICFIAFFFAIFAILLTTFYACGVVENYVNSVLSTDTAFALLASMTFSLIWLVVGIFIFAGLSRLSAYISFNAEDIIFIADDLDIPIE